MSDAGRSDAGGSAPSPVAAWVETHDDRWSFTLAYVGLALLLSTAISLFWLVAVVLAHGVLEAVALRRRGIRDRLTARVLWHLKLDLVLVLGALALGVYFDVLFGVAGLGPAARGGAQLTARVLAWQRAIRGVVLSADDVALVARAAAARWRSGAAPATAGRVELATDGEVPWAGRWSWGDRLTLIAGAALAAALVMAPVWTAHDVASAVALVAAELHPWPGR